MRQKKRRFKNRSFNIEGKKGSTWKSKRDPRMIPVPPGITARPITITWFNKLRLSPLRFSSGYSNYFSSLSMSLFYFLTSLARSLSILWYFQRTTFCFHWYFLLLHYFLIYWFLFLCYFLVSSYFWFNFS